MSWARKRNRIDTVPAAFIGQIERLLPEVQRYLLNQLSLDLVNGRIARTEANVLKVLAATDNWGGWMTDLEASAYGRNVRSFMAEFTRQKRINDGLISAFGQVPTASQVVYTAARRRTVELLVGDGFKTNFVDRIRDTVLESVTSSRSFADMTAAISDALGLGEGDGQLLNWTKQVAHDRFAMTDRAYMQAAADELEVNWFRYAGGLIENTREFCEHRNGQIFHRSEIEGWAALDWAGKMNGTDEETIFQNLGGYRCNHSLQWVPEGEVPPEVRARVGV